MIGTRNWLRVMHAAAAAERSSMPPGRSRQRFVGCHSRLLISSLHRQASCVFLAYEQEKCRVHVQALLDPP